MLYKIFGKGKWRKSPKRINSAIITDPSKLFIGQKVTLVEKQKDRLREAKIASNVYEEDGKILVKIRYGRSIQEIALAHYGVVPYPNSGIISKILNIVFRSRLWEQQNYIIAIDEPA